MKIIIRSDRVILEGYVNAVERNSKPLTERGVTFVERIKAGAFKKALERAKDVRIWVNHLPSRDIGGISDGNLTLEEDAIGLKARAEITDPEAIEDARRGNYIGWSFGFRDRDGGVVQLKDEETGLPLRLVKDMDLSEVSILNRKRSPAYVGTLVNVRDDGTQDEERAFFSSEYCENIETVEEPEEITEERAEADPEPVEAVVETPEEVKAPEEKKVSSVYYARYRNMIDLMRKA